MKNKKSYKHQKKFISHIVQYLHMDMLDFKKCREEGKCYESIIYRWVIKLYKKDATPERAIQVICRARIFILTRNSIYLASLRNTIH
jgi:hypothetical protein